MWKVIVADDEPFIREALKEMIPWDELGCHLAEALKNGKEVVNAEIGRASCRERV